MNQHYLQIKCGYNYLVRNKIYALLKKKKILEWVAIPSPGDLPDPEIKPMSPTLQADSLPSEP